MTGSLGVIREWPAVASVLVGIVDMLITVILLHIHMFVRSLAVFFVLF